VVAVALNSAFKDTAIAAVDRLSDRTDLEHVAERSNNKSAVKRARGIIREMDERAVQAAAPPPADPAQAATNGSQETNDNGWPLRPVVKEQAR